jgi:hypothetical protein
MRKTTMNFFVLVVCIAFIALSCKKGDTGPAGATGPAGPAGPAGPTGPAGSANVIYSAWLDVAFSPEDDDGDGTPDFYSANIKAPKLTSAIVNSGEVKVYLNIGVPNDPYVVPIPYSNLILSAFYVGNIDLTSGDDLSTINTSGGKSLQYRYILIPGGEGARLAAGGTKINWNNYQEVKAYLQLND